MNTAKISFTGTIQELVLLLEQHRIIGPFTANIRVTIGESSEIRLIRELMACEGGYIATIKLCRQITGMCLKEAKEFVDSNLPGDRFPNKV